MVGRASRKAPLGDPEGFLNSVVNTEENNHCQSANSVSEYRSEQLYHRLHGHCVEYSSRLCSVAFLKFQDVSQSIEVACVVVFLLCVHYCGLRGHNIRVHTRTLVRSAPRLVPRLPLITCS